MKVLLTVPWQSPARYFLAFFSLLLLWTFRHSLTELWAGHLGGSPWELMLVPFLGAAFWAGYAALADGFNRTHVESDGKTLRIRHLPIPWPAPAPIALDQIKGLKVAARVVSSDSRQMVTHILQAELKSGKTTKLLKLNSKKKAQEYLSTLREQIATLP